MGPRRRRLALVGAALVAVAGGLVSQALAQNLRTLPPSLAASAAVIEDVALEAFAGTDRAGKDGPLAAVGLDLARIYAAAALPDGLEALQATSGVAGAPIVRGDRVLIDATAVGTGADLLRDLEVLGLQNGIAFGRVVSGELPIAELPRAAALSGLRGATPARAFRSVGSVTSQGDASMRADAARLEFGVDGTGIAVGTLSDSYDCSPTASTSAADDLASGDLPAGIVVLNELDACVSAIDEGRAMMQLIYDVAPGASQLFHTAFEGQASFAQGILDLAAAGADVIVDDVFYFAEPFFQDGIIAQAVDQVVAAGVPYFSSMGNQADQSYEGAYRGAPPTGPFVGDYVSLHDFDPGPGVDIVQQIVVAPGATVTIILQWDDPFASAGVGNPGAAGDVDLFVTDVTGAAIIAQSVVDNVAGGDPVEILSISNGGGAPASAGIVIALFGGAQPTTVKYAFLGNMTVAEYATNSATGFGHANASGATGVGAAWYAETPAFGQDPPLREPFSSLGGVPIYFDVAGNRLPAPVVRNKPEITAPDGTDTTFFGFDVEPNGFPNFFGTSAAAPHAAAVAALLLDLAPSATPTEVNAALAQTAIDMDAPGFDFWTGAGLIQADAALLTFTGTVGFASPTFEAAEGDGTASITVERNGGSAGAISVDYATSDGSATAASDYVAVAGTLSWADGDASPKSIVVPLLDDATLEGDEDLTLVLSNPIATTIDRADATLTIADAEGSSIAATKGAASPTGALASTPGERVLVLQLDLSAPVGAWPATIDTVSARISVEGSSGAPTDVAAVRLFLDADGDGAIDAGSTPIAVAAPDADGDLVLTPTGLDLAAEDARSLLVELEFGGSLATLPSGAPLAALALPMLFGLAGLRRRRLLGAALLALLFVAACAGPTPPARSADVTIEIVAIDARAADPGVTVTVEGLPIAGSTVTVTD